MAYYELTRRFEIAGLSIRLLIDVSEDDLMPHRPDERADDIVFAMNAIINEAHTAEEVACIAVDMFTCVTAAEVTDNRGNGAYATS